jgi:hypothetical protein
MILLDVNVLVYAFREDATDHARYRSWLQACVTGPEPVALTGSVLSGTLRVLTHQRVFAPPTPLANALAFVEALRAQPACVLIEPGDRHWDIFARLCMLAGAKGNLVPDAWLAALAIEQGCEFITADRDFARFPGLRFRRPFA